MIFMKTLIVYESKYGNTEQIAKAIGASIQGDVSLVRSTEGAGAINGAELLIVGAPTYGGKPMPEMQAFLDRIPDSALTGIKTAGFDTRLKSRFASMFGYAAPKIAEILHSKGGTQLVPPEGFIVKRSKGPLLEGELERATAWGKRISDLATQQAPT